MGIALPHARMREVERPVGAFIQLATPVDYDAIDQRPVDLAFGMLVPESAREEHLQLLARLAGLFSHPRLCAELRDARTPEQVVRHFEEWESVPVTC